MRRYLVTSRLLLLSAVLAVGIGLLVANQLTESRAAIWQRAQAANANLLFTVSHVLERTLRSAELSVQHTIAQIERADGDVFSLSLSDRELFGAMNHDNQDTALVLDHNGNILRASSPELFRLGTLSSRDYFVFHRQNPDHRLYLSRPFRSLADGQFSVAFSHPWARAEGTFGGIVVQTIKLTRLHELFSSIELGPDSGINVFLSNGTIVTRFPYTGETAGQSLAGTENFDRFIREKEGSFTGVAAMDEIQRLYTFRVLDDYPLLVNVAQTTNSIFDVWRRDAWWLGAATLILMLGCFVLAGLAEHELRARRRAARRLRRAESDIRMILDSLPALVSYWDVGLVNRFSNRAHTQWMGLMDLVTQVDKTVL